MEMLGKRSFVKSSKSDQFQEKSVKSDAIEKRKLKIVKKELAEANEDIERMDYTIRETWDRIRV